MEDKIYTTRCLVCDSIDFHYLKGHENEYDLYCQSCGSEKIKVIATEIIEDEKPEVDKVKESLIGQELIIMANDMIASKDDATSFVICPVCGSEYGRIKFDSDEFRMECKDCFHIMYDTKIVKDFIAELNEMEAERVLQSGGENGWMGKYNNVT